MNRYFYNDAFYTPKELSDISGIPAHTIRDRLRRGYSVDQAVSESPVFPSVLDFCNASYYDDWIDHSVNYVYGIYWNWCNANQYPHQDIRCFTRQIMEIYPMLKVIPCKKDGKCVRMIRERK